MEGTPHTNKEREEVLLYIKGCKGSTLGIKEWKGPPPFKLRKRRGPPLNKGMEGTPPSHKGMAGKTHSNEEREGVLLRMKEWNGPLL